MKRPKKLSASFVKTVNRPGRYGDGRGGFGLSLLVKPTTTGRLSKTWSQRLRIHGRSVNIGLGAYPVVTLAEAREVALANRRTVARGRDPRSGGVPTFAEAVETVIAIHSPSWRSRGKYEANWRGTLRNHALPRIGHKPVSAITTADVMGVLLADDFWNSKRVTAQRVRQRIGAVMKWAVAQGYREDNPAGDAISAALPQERHPRPAPAGVAARRGCGGAQPHSLFGGEPEHQALRGTAGADGLPERRGGDGRGGRSSTWSRRSGRCRGIGRNRGANTECRCLRAP